MKKFFHGISAFLVSLLSVLKSCPPCPVCMPKYAAILSFFGIPLADYNHYLIPLMLASMGFTLIMMYWQAKKSSLSYLPLVLSVSACSLIIASKYLFHLPMVTYSAMGLFLIGVVLGQHNLKKASTCCASHKKQAH